MRAVIDTGVLISALIRPRGPTGEVLRLLRLGRFQPLYSTDMLVEIIDVLTRPVFRSKYGLTPGDVTALINLIRLRGEAVTTRRRVHACRDPKDDNFLEAALAAGAACIVSGDADLLALTPFEGIPILRPGEFVQKFLE